MNDNTYYGGPQTYDTAYFASQEQVQELRRQLNVANATITIQDDHIQSLEAQIRLVSDWFELHAPELQYDGTACQNAVDLLSFYISDSPDVMEDYEQDCKIQRAMMDDWIPEDDENEDGQ